MDYNVVESLVGSLDNHEGSVEKYQDNEVIIPMDEEAVKERPIILPVYLLEDST